MDVAKIQPEKYGCLGSEVSERGVISQVIIDGKVNYRLSERGRSSCWRVTRFKKSKLAWMGFGEL